LIIFFQVDFSEAGVCAGVVPSSFMLVLMLKLIGCDLKFSFDVGKEGVSVVFDLVENPEIC
jgi:hypothetical protein